MRSLLCVPFLFGLLTVPAFAQKRSAPAAEPTFPEATEKAKKAFDNKEYGAAVTALQAAIRAVQKLQRVAILEALPKATGFEVRDDEARNDDPTMGAAAAFLGLQVTRHYTKGEQSLDVEVSANAPMAAMLAMMFANPAILKSEGGEVVEYGRHKAVLKKNGDTGQELTILLFDKHVVKATANGMTAEEVLAIVDQAMVDRVEKALGS